MARTDAIVLGAGIVGISVALHLAKRGLSVALVERARRRRADLLRQCRHDRGQHAICRRPFRPSLRALLRVALKRASEANYHLSLPAAGRALAAGLPRRVAAGSPRRNGAARSGRCLRARVAEHETLMAEAGALALSAQDRLAEDLPQRDAPSPRWQPEFDAGARIRPAAASRSTPQARRRSSPRSIRCSSTRCSGRRRRA